jgi:hypothetical protein
MPPLEAGGVDASASDSRAPVLDGHDPQLPRRLGPMVGVIRTHENHNFEHRPVQLGGRHLLLFSQGLKGSQSRRQ